MVARVRYIDWSPSDWLSPVGCARYDPAYPGGGMTVRVLPGDMRDVLGKMIADGERVQSIVTDPPYHLQSIVKRFANSPRTEASMPSAGPYERQSRGFMGKMWDGGDIAFQSGTWRLCWELLPPGGHMVAFAGTRTYHRMAVAIEDAGFEIRDTIGDFLAGDSHVQTFLASLTGEQRTAFFKCVAESSFGGVLAWVFGSGFPKSRNVAKAIDSEAGIEREAKFGGSISTGRAGPTGNKRCDVCGKWLVSASPCQCPRPQDAAVSDAARQWEGWGTALKPAMELICLARKPLDGTVAGNVLAHGTGALNIDGCRIATDETPSANRRNGKPPGRELGSWANDRRSAETYAAERPGELLGRWPANVCHDGSEEVVSAFPDSASCNSPSSAAPVGSILGGARSQGAIYPGEKGSAARFFYSSKADADDRLGSKHPTVKPVDLMRWLVRLVTPPGGTVLDPFAGSGTTGMACMAEGLDCILVEREAEYVADIRKRLAHVRGEDTPLFSR